MKKISLLVFGVALTLLACNGPRKVIQTMEIRASDSSKVMTLIQATERVMDRRLAALNLPSAHASVIPTGTKSATLTVTVPDGDAAAKVEAILAEEFTFDLRIEKSKPKLKESDPEESEWIPTALTGSSLEWVRAVGNKNTGRVSIELQFTERGRILLESIFKENIGKNIGIFVRDILMSKVSVTSADVSDTVVIGGIPSATIAEVFADDVNVGLLVNFSPAP